MEDLKREFEDEQPKPAPSHEATPPKRPDKVPIDERPEIPPRVPMKQSSSHVLSSSKARSSTAGLLDPNHADAATGSANPRPVQSYEDMDLARPQSGEQQSEDENIRREMEQLRTQLREANSRAEQAERAAEVLTRQLKPPPTEVEADAKDSSAGAIRSLQAENSGLKAELDEARSHIFSLQPYLNDLTPNEVGQDFDDLVNGITDWVTNVMEPVLDDDDRIDEFLAAAKKRVPDVQKLKRYLLSQGDLVHGCMFPETDVDIMIATVLRFLQDNIFQKVLFGAVPDTVEVLSSVEASMQTNVEPKRDLFALRTWRAEALNAVICSPDYHRARSARIRDLTAELASFFRVFKKDKDSRMLFITCQDDIIKPAVRLHEKLMTSTHHFYLDLNTYVMWTPGHELEISPDFMHDLPKLKCENILQNRKPFSVAKLDPQPTKEQLYRELVNVATVVPALYMRQVGKGDVIKEPAAVRPQQMLVAWGSDEKRNKFLANGERTLLHRLCFPRPDRHERSQEGGTANPWTWRNMQWA